ncbi:MAG: PRC-barrel domain-containing protein [Ilumatobacteraceae bacterium]
MNAALLRGADIIGQPVVSIATGDDLAEIKDVVFDARQGTITGFTLRKRGFLGRRMKNVLPAAAVASVGTHAVMVDNDDALTHPDDAPDDTAADGNRNVLNDMVITESGRSLGTVKDVIVVGGATPTVVGFEIGGGSVGAGLIPIAAKRGVSGSSLIVPDGYEQRIRTDLTGLAAELATIEGNR